jgi:ribosomal protein L40E
MVGRGSRITETKKEFIILDFGNNISTHGLWESDRIWSLENPKKKKRSDVCGVKNCPECNAFLAVSAKKCKFCGYEFISVNKPKTEIEILLQKLTPSEINRAVKNDSFTVAELEQIRIIREYSVGWVLHKLKDYNEFLEYEKLKKYKNGWANYNSKRYLGR